MKKILKYSVYLFAGVLISSGCKKQVDVQPTDLILPEFAFTTVDNLQAGLNTAYQRYDGENTAYIASLLSDEARYGRDNAGQGQFTFRWQYGQDATTGGEVTQGWRTFYSMIAACNIVLDNIDKVFAVNSADSARKIQIRAQALGLRALAHFELHERYSKGIYNPTELSVPFVSSFIDPISAPTPKRDTSVMVLSRIQSDLRLASSLMGATTPANFTDVVLNKLNITALQARISLYKREWQKAIDSATVVINSGIRPLGSSAQFAGIWSDANLTSEVLFRTKRNSAASSLGSLFTTTLNGVYFSPSIKLRGMYAAGDIRPSNYFAFFAPNTIPENWVVFKYFQSALGGKINDFKGMRIPEMYLIRAEALIELSGDGNAGTPDLITLRTARSAGAVPVFADKTAGINFVLDERMRELCFEGFRFFDLKRKGLGVDRNPLDVESSTWLTLPAGNYRFALPIPVAEIQANPNVIQNQNY
jgi:hypothetical protein